MKKCINGVSVEITPEELAAIEAEAASAEAAYWQSIDYGEAVNAKIRERYSESQEFAILRQKDDKPEEYAEYFAFCENCKAAVKEKIAKFSPPGLT